MDKEQLIKEWFELEEKYRLFVLRVLNSGGSKHGSEPHSDNIGNNLWEKPEDQGWITSIGSYKFKVTDKFASLLVETKEQFEGDNDASAWLKYLAPKKVTKDMAETVVNLICSQLNDNARGLILYRLDRTSVASDSWTVVPPPVGIQVQLVNSNNEVVDKKIFDKDLTREWEGEEFGWRYDLDWLYDKYQEIVEFRSHIKNQVCVTDRFDEDDDELGYKAPDYLIDAILKTYFDIRSNSDINIYDLRIEL